MQCRVGCGACCIAISITSPLPGMPKGKEAGQRCLHLSPENKCMLFGRPERPSFCLGFAASLDICGLTYQEAYANLSRLEDLTKPF